MGDYAVLCDDAKLNGLTVELTAKRATATVAGKVTSLRLSCADVVIDTETVAGVGDLDRGARDIRRRVLPG